MPASVNPRRRPPGSPFRDDPAPVHQHFEVDDRVIHDRHGVGRVLRRHGDRMEVKFGVGVVDVDTRSTKIHLL